MKTIARILTNLFEVFLFFGTRINIFKRKPKINNNNPKQNAPLTLHLCGHFTPIVYSDLFKTLLCDFCVKIKMGLYQQTLLTGRQSLHNAATDNHGCNPGIHFLSVCLQYPVTFSRSLFSLLLSVFDCYYLLNKFHVLSH